MKTVNLYTSKRNGFPIFGPRGIKKIDITKEPEELCTLTFSSKEGRDVASALETDPSQEHGEQNNAAAVPDKAFCQNPQPHHRFKSSRSCFLDNYLT